METTLTSSVSDLRSAETRNSGILAIVQVAYATAEDTRAQYIAYAHAADREKFAAAAILFRAAARGQAILAANQAAVIAELGGTPQWLPSSFLVKSTPENLKAAIGEAIYTSDEWIPRFLRRLRARGALAALRTFHFTKKAAAGNARLFQRALENLNRSAGESTIYHVCPECGFAFANGKPGVCPICIIPADRLERFA
jgi:rubrerythrin